MPKVSVQAHQQGETTILNFTIAGECSDFTMHITEPVNINDMILVKFQIQFCCTNKPIFGLPSLPEYMTSISFKKITKAKKDFSAVKVKVKGIGFEEEWDCTDTWVEKSVVKNNHNICVNNTVFSTLEINISTNETKAVPPQMQKLYEDEDLIDFNLRAADGTVGIHKTQLAMQGDFFMTMLKNEWKETLEGQIGIEGFKKKNLEDFKRYLYLGTLPEDDLEPLLVIADRYMLDNLKADCIEKIIKTITPEKLDYYVEFACLNNLPDLMRTIMFKTPQSVVTALHKLKTNGELHKDKTTDAKEEA